MKGGIYPTKYGYQVRFGTITKRFKRHELVLAERFLTGLRFKSDEGTFDRRDYQKSNPLGLTNQIEKFIESKRHLKAVKKYEQRLRFAVDAWGNRNIKTIGYADIEDLINSLRDAGKSSYYIKHIRDTIRQFFKWLVDRQEITRDEAPQIPTVKAKMNMRKIVDKETQTKILNQIWESTKDINPRIYLAIYLLTVYVKLRPCELLSAKEKSVDYDSGILFIEGAHEKNGDPKIIYLLDDDLAAIKSLGRSFPEMHIFRHTKGNGTAKPGDGFGRDFLQKHWNSACKDLGIKGVSLYPGTRHSSAVDLRKSMSPEAVKRSMGTKTKKAFDQYLQVTGDELRPIYARAQTDNKLITFPVSANRKKTQSNQKG